MQNGLLQSVVEDLCSSRATRRSVQESLRASDPLRHLSIDFSVAIAKGMVNWSPGITVQHRVATGRSGDMNGRYHLRVASSDGVDGR